MRRVGGPEAVWCAGWPRAIMAPGGVGDHPLSQSAMKLTIHSFGNGAPIPGTFALCVPAPAEAGYAAFAPNRNPHLAWEGEPEGTRSFAVLMHDPDAPTVPDDVNQEGRTVPRDLPRGDFFHWVLVDIPPEVHEIRAAADSDGVIPRGKPTGQTPLGVRGRNDYTAWFQGDPDMEGVYGGYDGPCPPWNDERIHRYVFTVFALDVPSLGISSGLDGPRARKAMEGHVLAEASWIGTYTMNEALAGD